MTRLASTLRLDVQLQARSWLYSIGIVAAVFMGGVCAYFLDREMLRFILPSMLVLGMGNTTYMFVAGMVLFEKGEQTFDAQIVTPLRVREYLASKALTLTGFAMVESAIVLAIAYGFGGFRPLPLVTGLAVLGLLFTLCGLIQVVRYDSVTDFLMPAAFLVGTFAALPVFGSLRLWSTPLWYLWPTQPPLIFLEAAFLRPVAAWQLVYAVVYSAVCLVVAAWWAQRAFERFIVGKAGG